jgi:phospholipid/cholesterol/gamma-HCH transport system substrate-binding protein
VSLKLAIQRYARFGAIIVAIWIVASACAAYVLSKQRLASPFANNYKVHAEFTNLTGATPGIGLPVNVAGVHVGQLSKINVVDGRAVATMLIDPDELPHIYKDGGATLIPITLAKNMQINLRPGTPKAGVLSEDEVLPSSHNQQPIDLDELLSVLDADTRQWFSGLLREVGIGLNKRGPDVRKLLHQLGPTSEQLREIGELLAERRHTLPKLVHNLASVTKVAGSRDKEIGRIVTAGNQTLGAIASQDVALRNAIIRLPWALNLTADTLTNTKQLTDELTPALRALTPTARNLKATLRDSKTLFEGGALLPIPELRRFVKEAQPLTTTVPPAVRDLTEATPLLNDAFRVLQYTVNETAYDPPGADKGFLYWIPWAFHNLNSATSSRDARGPVVRGMAMVGCSSLAQAGALGDLLETLIGGTGACAGGGTP